MRRYLILVTTLLIVSATIVGQTAERQKSFALESKPHSYYVEQSELWWKEIEKNKHSEDNWYNYYKACRNAQGTANWSEDFAKESIFLDPS